MLAYQLTLRSGKEDPEPCVCCKKPTRGMAVTEEGYKIPLCPAHLNDEMVIAALTPPARES